MLTELPDVERVRKFLNWKVMLSGHAENTQAQVEYSVNWSQRRLWGWGWCLSGYYYCGFLVFFLVWLELVYTRQGFPVNSAFLT